jgi:hypothetical protein
MMVNYVYRLDRIDELAQAYADHGRINASAAVTALFVHAAAKPGDVPAIPSERSS